MTTMMMITYINITNNIKTTYFITSYCFDFFHPSIHPSIDRLEQIITESKNNSSNDLDITKATRTSCFVQHSIYQRNVMMAK